MLIVDQLERRVTAAFAPVITSKLIESAQQRAQAIHFLRMEKLSQSDVGRLVGCARLINV
jgi:hypothetical protein